MASDIDELLEWMRDRPGIRSPEIIGPPSVNPEASDFARYIAAVEELVTFKANHTGDATVTLAPPVGLQPMAILDPPEPLPGTGYVSPNNT